jgi:regulatory protein
VVKRLSLKARALTWLAQREHSRAELRRKLMRVVQAAERSTTEAGISEPSTTDSGADSAASQDASTRLPATELRRSAGHRSAHFGAVEPGVGRALVAERQEVDRNATVSTTARCTDSAHCVELLLDWLEAHGYLSDSRFIQSRIHTRAGRYGNLRIRYELEQHGLELDEQTLKQLRDSEIERAREVWARKFGVPPADAATRARQLRFLAQRGFSIEVASRVVRGGEDDFG